MKGRIRSCATKKMVSGSVCFGSLLCVLFISPGCPPGCHFYSGLSLHPSRRSSPVPSHHPECGLSLPADCPLSRWSSKPLRTPKTPVVAFGPALPCSLNPSRLKPLNMPSPFPVKISSPPPSLGSAQSEPWPRSDRAH